MQLTIRDIVFLGQHGVTTKERSQPQRFKVSVVLNLTPDPGSMDDDLTATLNWSAVRRRIKEIIETASFALVETLAAAITNDLLKESRIEKVQVTVEKLDAWHDGNGVPGITLTRP